MDLETWNQKWRDKQIAFHETTTNPALEKYGGQLLRPPGCSVLVPLSGKSVDLLWLEQQGATVTAVEWAEAAVVAFHQENNRTYSATKQNAFKVFRSGAISSYVGDLFGFSSAERFDAIYDRAALIALPPAQREPYAKKMLDLLAAEGRMLLVTLEHDGDFGPPFSVREKDVVALYGNDLTIHTLDRREEKLDRNDHLGGKGATRLTRTIYLLSTSARNG